MSHKNLDEAFIVYASTNTAAPAFDCDRMPDDFPTAMYRKGNGLINRELPDLYVQKITDDYTLDYTPSHVPVVFNMLARQSLAHFERKYSKNVDDILSAWLHITDRCNLRCAYCYLPHVKQDMSWETGQRVVDSVLESAVKHGYPQVKLKYSGGEALLRFPFVEKLHRYAMKQTEAKGLILDAVLLSNGTLLTSDIAQIMKVLGLRLMISLDGLGAAHDAQRAYSSGKGSFQDVERGINIALEHGLIPDISITVSGKNAHGLPDVVGWVLDRDLPFSLNFYRENDLSASHADLQLEEETIISGMLAAYKVIEENVPRRSLLASLVDRGNLSAPHEHTCGVGNNYMVFDYKGRVSKCQMQMEHAVTTIDADDPLELIRTDTIGIQNISVEEKEGCRDCEWKYWCAGGCPLTTYRATGRYDVKSPNCNIYKAIYPQAMRLEGLRLLKYHLHDDQIETVPALQPELVEV